MTTDSPDHGRVAAAVASLPSAPRGWRSLFFRLGRWEVFARRERPDHRWAWLALVKEGPSLEIVAGPAAVTVSWGVGAMEDKARVWAWRRAVPAAAPPGGR